MSRCVLDNEARNIDVVIGWDPGMQSFFVRVFDNNLAVDAERGGAEEDAAEQAALILWTGGFDRTYTSWKDLDLLIEGIRPYACPHDTDCLRRQLLEDQSRDDGERIYGFNGSELEEC